MIHELSPPPGLRVFPIGALAALAALVALVVACGDNQTHPDVPPDYDAGAVAPLSCLPNLDGKIEAKELAPTFGVPAHYLVSPANGTRQVDVVGTVQNGRHVWDESARASDDGVATIAASKLDGKWYASSFPGADFATPFDAGDTIEAIYAHSDAALSILGLASHDESPPEGKTLVVYDQPVALYKFPLTPGVTYTSTGTARNGFIKGLPYAGVDAYAVKVDAAGELRLPDLTLSQALRVRITTTTTPAAGQVTTVKQVQWLSECIGEAMRATSRPNETADDFTVAAEVRRLGLVP